MPLDGLFVSAQPRDTEASEVRALSESDAEAMHVWPVHAELWAELVAEGLLPPHVPTPAGRA